MFFQNRNKLLFYYSRYNYDFLTEETEIQKNDLEYFKHKTSVFDFAIKNIFYWKLTNKISANFGYSSVVHNFLPGNYVLKLISENKTILDTNFSLLSQNSIENNAFAETKISPTRFIELKLGINISNFIFDEKILFYPHSRLLAVVKFNSTTSLKMSYGQMVQAVHLLTSNTPIIPYDIWITASDDLLPATSSQFSAGLHKSLKKNIWEFSFEAYYKNMQNLIAFKEGETFLSITKNWQNKILSDGIGKTYGIEILIRKKQGKTTGWLSYSYSRSYRYFPDLNNNEIFPFKYDRPHYFNFLIIEKVSKNTSFSANWKFASGQPITLPIGIYNSFYDNNSNFWTEQNFIVFSKINQYRMRAYHRLDIAANFSKKVKRGIRTWTISVYNVYNRQNPYFYYTKQVNGQWHLYQQSLFPIIPSISYSLKF